ncbi:sodium:phosphate symporter [Halomicrococcus gelatinilyticus]|uniref:sodium:phosphate symporter n=1 Tax=Halomicrococcus gelatinilyticus TaxID=1702103 RepID=UPI002E111BDA
MKAIATVLLFLFAIRLLGAATDALSPFLRGVLREVVVGDVPALGVSWLASYLLANGSVVAALALSLFDADLIVTSQLYLMIVGSRLGAAAIVVFIGAFDYVHEELGTLRESVSLGLLAFLLTHSIYLPVLVLGYLVLPLVTPAAAVDRAVPGPETGVPDVLSVATGSIIDGVGAGAAFALALGAIFLSMRSFDRILDGVDKQQLRDRYISRLQHKWTSFVVGLVVTGFTTSIAFSLGVVVPLYNRGHVKRSEIMPYVLGANIGTLVDTLVVAVALDTPVGVTVVALLLVVGLVVTMLALLLYPLYTSVIDAVQSEILSTVAYFVAFLVSLLVVPLLLVFIH